MPTQFNFQGVLDAFAYRQPVDVVDYKSELVYGVWTEVGMPERRQVSAIVLTVNDKNVSFREEGNVTEAKIALITNDELFFFSDISEATLQKQSYVNVHGTTFKVVSSGMFLANSGHRQYIAVRYVE